MIKKPIVLSLLFMLFLYIVTECFSVLCTFLKIQIDIVFYTLIWAISAFILGLIYTKIKKEPLSKNQKIKIVSYTLSVLLLLYLFGMTILLDLFEASPFRLIVRLLFLILPTFMIVLSAFCAYPALGLGSRIASIDKSAEDKKANLYDVLIIIFCILFGMFAIKFNTYALDKIKPHVIKYSESKGYIRKIPTPVIKKK